MPISMPAGVVFSYNGWTFGPYCSTKVREEPVTSGDNRTVKYSRITIEVTGWITQNDIAIGSGAAATATVAAEVVTAITVTNGGSGYTEAPLVQISAPDVAGSPQATATATVSGGAVTAVTITNGGNGYTNPPTISFIAVSPGAGTIDSTMQTMRRALQAHGKALRYVNKGYGADLAINVPGGTVRDVAMGPRAGTLRWRPIGGAPIGCAGASFAWEVSTTIPECKTAIFGPGAGVFTEISFSVQYETAESGLVTITSSGRAEIPLSLNDAGNLDTNIDAYIRDVIPEVPSGFIRRMTRTLAPDRQSCQFTITDRQIEVPYPDNVVEIEMKHSIRQVKTAGVVWDNTINGTLRMDPAAPKGAAWSRFFAIVSNRMWQAGVVPAAGRPLIQFPRLQVTENLFKNSSDFSLSWQLLNVTYFNVFAKAGLWLPLQTTNFTTWNASLATSALAKLGILGKRFDNGAEVIIDACTYTRAGAGDTGGGDWGGDSGGDTGGGDWGIADVAPADVVAAADSNLPTNLDISPADFFAPADEGLGGSSSTTPPTILLPPSAGGLGGMEPVEPDQSWFDWRCTVSRIGDHHTVRHKPLAGTVTYQPPGVNPAGAVTPVIKDTSAPSFGVTNDTADIIQQTASPSFRLRLRGFAIRVGFRINPPKLISFGGVTPVLQHENVAEATLGQPMDLPLYRLEWDLIYLLPQPPAAVDVLANPLDQTDGTQV